MGFFKDFKDDFSEAVNDLVPDAEELEPTEEATVNTLDEEIDVASELSKLDGLLEQVTKRVDGEQSAAATTQINEVNKTLEDKIQMDTKEVVNETVQTTAQQPVAPVAPSAPVADETAVMWSSCGLPSRSGSSANSWLTMATALSMPLSKYLMNSSRLSTLRCP